MLKEILLIFSFNGVLSSYESKASQNISNNDYLWKKRLVICATKLSTTQKKVIQDNMNLSNDLKLKFIESKKLKDQCQLIGLDGGTKLVSKQAFSIQKLEEVIKSMPMRMNELRNR